MLQHSFSQKWHPFSRVFVKTYFHHYFWRVKTHFHSCENPLSPNPFLWKSTFTTINPVKTHFHECLWNLFSPLFLKGENALSQLWKSTFTKSISVKIHFHHNKSCENPFSRVFVKTYFHHYFWRVKIKFPRIFSRVKANFHSHKSHTIYPSIHTHTYTYTYPHTYLFNPVWSEGTPTSLRRVWSFFFIFFSKREGWKKKRRRKEGKKKEGVVVGGAIRSLLAEVSSKPPSPRPREREAERALECPRII